MSKNKILKSLIVSVSVLQMLSSCARTDRLPVLPVPQINSSSLSQASDIQISEKALMELFMGRYDEEEQLVTINSTLFGDNGVNMDDIQQGKRPVCYFLASLAGLANQRPDDIKKLVSKNTDGTYTVTFPGLPERKNMVIVEEPSQEELDTYIHKGKNGSIWVPVVVKAIARYWSKNGFFRFFRSDDNSANYGGAWEGISVLTGNKPDYMLVDINNNSRIFSKINEALKNKKVVTTSTFNKGKTSKAVKGQLWLSKIHVYTVLSVDPIAETITLRDPYGKIKRVGENREIVKDEKSNGIITFSMPEYRKYFTDIALETDRKINFFDRILMIK